MADLTESHLTVTIDGREHRVAYGAITARQIKTVREVFGQDVAAMPLLIQMGVDTPVLAAALAYLALAQSGEDVDPDALLDQVTLGADLAFVTSPVEPVRA